jgi:hypothetical protein
MTAKPTTITVATMAPALKWYGVFRGTLDAVAVADDEVWLAEVEITEDIDELIVLVCKVVAEVAVGIDEVKVTVAIVEDGAEEGFGDIEVILSALEEWEDVESLCPVVEVLVEAAALSAAVLSLSVDVVEWSQWHIAEKRTDWSRKNSNREARISRDRRCAREAGDQGKEV